MDLAISTFLNPSGLSWVGQTYFQCFTNYNVRAIPLWIGPPEIETKDALDPALAEAMLLAATKPISDGAIQLHAGRADEVKALKSRSLFIGSMVLEGNRLNNEHIRICRGMDVVATPAHFCRNICLSSGVPRSKLFHLPYALDSKIWNSAVKPAEPKGDRFRFLFMNTFYERKGWDLLLRAFWQEFSADEPVELTIKSYRENDRLEPVEILVAVEAAKLGIDRSKKAPVVVIDELMPAQKIPSFMKSFDAYVSPHRSEGFGMNPWHAMALEVPVICTNYGGNTDFTKSDTSWLVGVSGYSKPSAKEAAIFPHLADMTWVEPDVEDLRRQMRLCFQNKQEAERRAKAGAALVASAYSYAKVMDCFEVILKAAAPGSWEKLCMSRNVELLARQPSPRFESADLPLKMMEI